MRTKTSKATTTASFWLSSLRKQPTFQDAITPRDITFEEWLQKFHTDDASLPRYGYCLWLVENLLGLIRSTTQIWVAMETCYQLSSVWNFCSRSLNVISRGNHAVMGSRNSFFFFNIIDLFAMQRDLQKIPHNLLVFFALYQRPWLQQQ